MAQGSPPARVAAAPAEPFLAVAPPAALAVAALALGLIVPGPLLSLLRQAAAALGGP